MTASTQLRRSAGSIGSAENCNGEFSDDDFDGKSPKFYSEYMKLSD